jgi:hypothetical protein
LPVFRRLSFDQVDTCSSGDFDDRSNGRYLHMLAFSLEHLHMLITSGKGRIRESE